VFKKELGIKRAVIQCLAPRTLNQGLNDFRWFRRL